jgi:hypothetical protein
MDDLDPERHLSDRLPADPGEDDSLESRDDERLLLPIPLSASRTFFEPSAAPRLRGSSGRTCLGVVLGESPIDLSCDVALQAADDLELGLAFGGPAPMWR